MKHIKKFILLCMLVTTCSIITGCEEEASVVNNPTNIDANQTRWNGYISERYKYLSEGDIRSNSNGAILRCVWSLAIYDSETDKTYSKYISDEIFMSSH